jgi:ribosomal protein L37AE/L43A
MQERYQCPDCKFKRMTKLKLLERWWCSFCDMEKDVEKTIKEWAMNGTRKEKHD